MSTEVSGHSDPWPRPALVRQAQRWSGLTPCFIPLATCLACLICLQSALAADAQLDLPVEDTIPVFVPLVTASADMLMAQDVSIGMRDGIHISLDIYRPNNSQSHPVLYAAGPYPHTRDLLNDTTSTVGPVAWYVSQGYAVVIASVRGTGQSSGEFTFLGRQEQQDHYEIIQWITAQSWSDGQVAGTGAGYYAAAQWQMAIQNPPGLTCIAPINGTQDPYREWVAPGGLANSDFIGGWYENRVRLPNAFAPGSPRLVNYDLRLAWLMHPFYDAYWQERSSRENTGLISVPVFAIHDWNQDRANAGFTTTLNSLGRLNVVNKLIMASPPGQLPLYQDTGFLARQLLPYYQWCFNGKAPASPYIERPRVQYQVRGQNSIKRESDWPPGNITHQAWFPAPNAGNTGAGRLTESQPQAVGFSNIERIRSNTTLRFVTERLEQDLEIAGPVMMELYAATTGSDMAFAVTLKEELVFEVPAAASFLPGFLDEAPGASVGSVESSTEILVTRGNLKASARLKDETRSTPYLPVYRLEGGDSLSPGQVYRLDIALRQTAYRFHAGNRVVLEVTPVNDGSLAATSRDTVYHNSRYPSRIWLPVVQSPQLSLPRPAPAFNNTTPNTGITAPLLSPFGNSNPGTTENTGNGINGDNGESPVIFVPQ